MFSNVQDEIASLYPYVRKIVNNRVNVMDADDVVQDVMLRALSHTDNIKGNNIKAWLNTVTINTVMDYYRRKKREPELWHDFRPIASYTDVIERLYREQVISRLSNNAKRFIQGRFAGLKNKDMPEKWRSQFRRDSKILRETFKG